MGLADCLKEIESTMMNAVNEGRELSGEEVIHILKLQAEEIKRQIQEDDGLSEEEALAEHFSNKNYSRRINTYYFLSLLIITIFILFYTLYYEIF